MGTIEQHLIRSHLLDVYRLVVSLFSGLLEVCTDISLSCLLNTCVGYIVFDDTPKETGILQGTY